MKIVSTTDSYLCDGVRNEKYISFLANADDKEIHFNNFSYLQMDISGARHISRNEDQLLFIDPMHDATIKNEIEKYYEYRIRLHYTEQVLFSVKHIKA